MSRNLRFSLAAGVATQASDRQTMNGNRSRRRGSGRFILDGYAIADECRMTNSSGELIVLGLNLRTYDATSQTWNIKWLNALAARWVRFDGHSIVYAFKEPIAVHAYTRATYTNISKAHFTWRGERSDDGLAWSDFMVVEAYRS